MTSEYKVTYTVKQLRDILKHQGLRTGYSHLNKAELIKCVEMKEGHLCKRAKISLPGRGAHRLSMMRVPALKDEAKKLGIKGYSKMRKEDLVKSILKENRQQRMNQGASYKHKWYEHE